MKSLIATVFGLILMTSHAQTESWFEVRPKAGFLIAHRSIMGHVANEHAFAAEVSYYFHGQGEKYWHRNYNNPRYGVSIFAGTVGNTQLLGSYYGAYSFMAIPLIHTKKYEFAGRLGAGLGIASKVYNQETNNLSIGTSTYLNALVSLSLENRFQFGDHAVNFIVDMTHFSNGATKVPNLGLNVPYMSLGYGYRVREAKEKDVSHPDILHRYWQFGLMGIASVQEVYPVGGIKYPVLGLNVVARKFFNHTTGMEISLDGMYKNSLRTYESDVPRTNGELLQLGIYAGYILPFDKFHLIAGMGYYLRDKFHLQEPVYHRVGMRYVFSSGLNLNLALKSHWARADYFEYGIGYTLKR